MKALNIPKVSSVPALRFVLFFIFSATVKAEELNTYGESPLSDFFEIRNHIQIEDEKLNMLLCGMCPQNSLRKRKETLKELNGKKGEATKI